MWHSNFDSVAWVQRCQDTPLCLGVASGIDLRGMNRRMPQKGFDVRDIHAFFQKQGGKGVTQHMGCYFFLKNGFSNVLDGQSHRLRRQRLIAAVEKKKVGCNVWAFVKIGMQNIDDACIVERGESFGIALALDNKRVGGGIKIIEMDIAKFGYSYACRKQEFYDGDGAEVLQFGAIFFVQKIQDFFHIKKGECFGYLFGDFDGGFDFAKRRHLDDILKFQVTKKCFEGCQFSSQGTGQILGTHSINKLLYHPFVYLL